MQALVALHGVNAGRAWRLTMADALAALGTGRYVFEVEYRGDRRRAELLGSDGSQRLFAPSPSHGDLIELLPDLSEQGGLAGAAGAILHAQEPSSSVAS